jgi:hypothetical protein
LWRLCRELGFAFFRAGGVPAISFFASAIDRETMSLSMSRCMGRSANGGAVTVNEISMANPKMKNFLLVNGLDSIPTQCPLAV